MRAGHIIPFRPRLERQWRSLAVARLLHNRRAKLDRLTDYLEQLKEREMSKRDLKIEAPDSEPVVLMTRTFDAPRELVWKAISEPEHVVRWWGPHGHTNRVAEFDFRIDGRWIIESTLPDGTVIPFNGEFKEIEKPVRLTQTFRFGDMPMELYSLDSVELVALPDGRTLYNARSVLPDFDSRAGMLASGMEVGVVEGFERLDAMLLEWQA
jgi:uncharacterized protein YndB with AHSA1/START domain